jgi:hypothetical protein
LNARLIRGRGEIHWRVAFTLNNINNFLPLRFLDLLSLKTFGTRFPRILIYRTGDFGYLAENPSYWFEHDIEIDEERLAALRSPSEGQYFEVENCGIVYAALANLTPYEARDERLWTYLSHTAFLTTAA